MYKSRAFMKEFFDKDFFKEFWNEKIEWAKKGCTESGSLVARIDGKHYVIGKENCKGTRGFSGAEFYIRFLTGEYAGKIYRTSNLWFQGEIPDEYKDKLPDNAEFVPVEHKEGISRCIKY